MFLVYLFAGAGIFLLLEKEDQQQLRNDALQTLAGFENALINATSGAVTDVDMQKLRELVEEALEVGAFGKRRFLTEWNLGNAFFFCGNVITTIGKLLLMFIFFLLTLLIQGYYLVRRFFQMKFISDIQ